MRYTGKEYRVRGSHGIEKTISIHGENESSFLIHMITKSQYGVLESDETLTRDLFDSCVRTGYLSEITAPQRTGNLTFAGQ